ncbi:hypothetical protein CU097_004546 [Rhizopus azygosporus]|uniref:Uncharacterized protein n=1 Tax=Rhizopus azygosporus TaxID=86630 RepID=A0A367J6K3_RHIAZ|nr:hypothetical protein CU097_004546 [Rhizopus azygosporus]
MFKDGLCKEINQLGNQGWHTLESDDWVYYPQQYVNVSFTALDASVTLVGGCCAPNRHKLTGFLYRDDGSSYKDTGNKIVAISDRPVVQNITIKGWYMQSFVDDGAVNLTLVPTINHPDKQSVFYELIAFDRAMVVTYQFFNDQDKLIGNYSSGLLRNSISIPDITLPRYTRRVVVSIFSSRADPMCFAYIYAGVYIYSPFTTLTKMCAKLTTLLQYACLGNFIVIPLIFTIMSYTSDFSFPPPVRFLCRAPANTIHMCIIITLGSFISSQAWHMLNSEAIMFHEWLPRAVRIIEIFLSFFLLAVYFYPVFICYHASYRSRVANIMGAYTILALFTLRVSIELPNYVIVYPQSQGFLVVNLLTITPTIGAYFAVFAYFITRSLTFKPCVLCSVAFLEVQDIEEEYVKRLLYSHKKRKRKARNHDSLLGRLWDFITIDWPQIRATPINLRKLLKQFLRYLFGIDELVRIPFAIKASLTLLVYCLAQLIPLLLNKMIGTGAVVSRHICQWSSYLVQLHNDKDPLSFAVKTYYFMRIVTYIAAFGGGVFCILFSLGILRRFTKDILKIRKGDYSLFKGKRNNRMDVDDAIRFLGVFIGFGFTGTLYLMLEVSIIGTFITMLIQLDVLRELLLKRLGYGAYFASFFVAIIVQFLQKRVTNLVFIESRTRFMVHHRAPFLHYWYFMMLTSMTKALISYFLRTLKLALRYPMYSLRVDRNAETWSVRNGDAGFTAYSGMILADHEYNNPIVLAFIECILDCIRHSFQKSLLSKYFIFGKHKRKLCGYHIKSSHNLIKSENWKNSSTKDSIKKISSDVKEEQIVSSRRARNRWFLVYTLVNNPQLRADRQREEIEIQVTTE